ncbi:hypothetical protein P7C73_g5358, partial [Tremellales sp. Uapishka_1]
MSPPYLSSAASLVKALKAASDPPQADWPTKIQIAKESWQDGTLYVPRKAEVLRDWILEMWSRVKPTASPNPLLQEEYHQLLLAVSAKCAQPVYPSLALFTSFFQMLDNAIPPSSVQSFRMLFPVEHTNTKAEAWVEVWIKMVAYLAREVVVEVEAVEKLVRIVCEGVSGSLPACLPQNRRKIAQSLHPSLAAYSRALVNYPSLRPLLHPMTAPLLFPLPILQTANHLADLLVFPLPTLRPHLLKAYISAIHQARYPLFTQPSSSKLPLDVFVASKVRDNVQVALSLILQLSDDAQANDLVEVWSCKLALWEVVASWGGYMETEARWGDHVDAEARKAEEALTNHAGEEGLAAKVLATLTVLEGLDHARTRIGKDVVGWCLASPAKVHASSLALLSSLLNYHVLTHSLPTFIDLLTSSLESLFPNNLPPEVVEALYTLVANGPLTDIAFGNSLKRGIRGMNVGGRRSSTWAGILDSLLKGIKTALTPSSLLPNGGETKKRKRTSGITASSAAIVGIASRLVKMVLDSSTSAKAGAVETEEVLHAAVGIWELDEEKPRKKRREWTSDVLMASRMRILRSAQMLQRNDVRYRMGREDEVVGVIGVAEALPELRLEAVEYFVQALALQIHSEGCSAPYTGSFIDSLLDILSLPGNADWSGRVASSKETVPAAVWQIVAERGMVLLDEIATPAQQERFAQTLLSLIHDPTSPRDLSVHGAVSRILSTSETWELPNIRSALPKTLTSSNTPNTFTFLNFAPTTYLSKSARSTLLEQAYQAESDRVNIRKWLARLAENDVLGELASDPKLIKRLLKSKDEDSSEIVEPTLRLLKPAFQHMCRQPETLPAVLDDCLKWKPFGKLAKKLKKDVWENETSDLKSRAVLLLCTTLIQSDTRERSVAMNAPKDVKLIDMFRVYSYSEAVKTQLRDISAVLVDNLQPAIELLIAQPKVLNRHVGITEAWKVALEFRSWIESDSIIAVSSQRLLSAVLQSSPSSELARATLESVMLESNIDSEKVLATFIVLSTAAPSDQVDEAFCAFVKSPQADFGAIAESTFTYLQSSLVQCSEHRVQAALHTLRLLMGVSADGSGKPIASITPDLLLLLSANLSTFSRRNSVESIRLISTLVNERIGLIRPPTASIILTILAQQLLQKPIENLDDILDILHTTIRHRADILLNLLPQLMGTLSLVFPALSSPSLATRFSRLLLALASSKPLANPLAKHLPALLIANVRATMGLSSETRKNLEAGVYGIMDLVTAGGRVEGRGREGEGLGQSFGLGDGQGGDAEKEIWAEMWRGWGKKRYVGQG